MLIVFRPSSEEVKDGRILHFVSGYRRFVARHKIRPSQELTVVRLYYEQGF
jgi:hypothetical protein